MGPFPLPPPSLVNGEDAAAYEQLATRRAAALGAIENRRVAERLRASARDAEQAIAQPVEEGKFTLVPDGQGS